MFVRSVIASGSRITEERKTKRSAYTKRVDIVIHSSFLSSPLKQGGIHLNGTSTPQKRTQKHVSNQQQSTNMVAIQCGKKKKQGNLLCVCFVCLGIITFLSLWRSSQLIEHGADSFTVSQGEDQDKRKRPYSDTTTDSIRLNMSSTQADTRPCFIAVTNSATYHFEILESVAAQLPLNYLNLKDCDTTSLIFDYYIVQYGPPPSNKRWKFWKFFKPWIPNQRSILYRSYFESTMKVKTFVEESSPTRRTIGELVLNRKNHERNPIVVTGYDATIEASCLCSSHYLVSLQQNKKQSCIFHERCSAVANHPRAVWVSPHHEQFFIPTVLPAVPSRERTIETKEPICLCVVGTTARRNWGLLQEFLRQMNGDRILASLRIHILGVGKFPAELELYKDMIQTSTPPGYREFHQQVAADCDAMLLLLTKTYQPDYFLGPESLLRLTGAIPLVMAYHKPVILHEELYTLYEKYFPSDLLVVTHTDEATSFTAAMWDLLNKLQNSSSLGGSEQGRIEQ